MPAAYHVQGPALIKTGTGAAGALESLGYSEDGVEISVREYREPVRTDVAGPAVPADLQHMGADAIIRARLSAYDLGVLVKVRKRHDATADGQLPTLGRLVGTAGDAFKPVIAGADEVWRVPTAILREAQDTKLGTRYTVWSLTFYAWAFIPATATTPKDIVLYDHTDA